jgi:pyridoxine/pyridoxamine 5'-phosphate oxidase
MVNDPVKLTRAVVLSVEFSAVRFESVKRHPSTRVPFRGRVWSALELLGRAVAFWEGVKDRTRDRVRLLGEVTLKG